jgi:uncharacterized protein YlxP (DUF503 family)
LTKKLSPRGACGDFFISQVSKTRLIDKTRQRFNVSIAEVATQDVQQTLTIGIAVVSGEASHAQESFDEIARFMEEHAFNQGAELTDIEMM